MACQIEQTVEVSVLLYARRRVATWSEAIGLGVLYHSRTYPAGRILPFASAEGVSPGREVLLPFYRAIRNALKASVSRENFLWNAMILCGNCYALGTQRGHTSRQI